MIIYNKINNNKTNTQIQATIDYRVQGKYSNNNKLNS